MRPLATAFSFLTAAIIADSADGSSINADTNKKVLRCGAMLDVTKGELLANVAIVVNGERIEAIVDDSDRPKTSHETDLTQSVCTPGFVDMHAHLMYNATGYSPAADALFTERSNGRKTLDGLLVAQQLLRRGFTTLRVPGDAAHQYASIEVKRAFERGDFKGPRMKVAQHYLTATGGHGDLNNLAPDVMKAAHGKIVSGVEGMREAVREQVKYGSDWIKVYASGGVVSHGDAPRVQSFTDEEIQAAVDEAHRYGKKITVHAHSRNSIRSAVLAGVDTIEHATFIDDDTIRIAKKKGIEIVPTLFVLEYVMDQGGFSDGIVAKARLIENIRNQRMRAAYKAGIRMTVGTDTIYPPEMGPKEFTALFETLEMTPADIMRAGTLNGALALGMEKDIGTIEVGKYADIVALPGNPLDNIQYAEQVMFVMKGGDILYHTNAR